MEISFNPRDNGACPICKKIASCPIRSTLSGSVAGFKDSNAHGLEVVVYSCPLFKEK
jgi:hypothetical protein